MPYTEYSGHSLKGDNVEAPFWAIKSGAMSQPLEQNTEAKKSSHEELEYYSDSDSELEEGSTTSEGDTFLSIWYPSLPHFLTPYLHNQDFRDTEKALKYIMKHFNLEMIHKSLQTFPDLSHDFIYSNTLWIQIVVHSLNVIKTNQSMIPMPCYKTI